MVQLCRYISSGKEMDSSPEEGGAGGRLSLDVDSGHSTAHSPVSRSSSTLSSCCRLQFHDATHRALHKFIPRHRDELEVDIGDPLYVQKEDDDLWAEDAVGISMERARNILHENLECERYISSGKEMDSSPEEGGAGGRLSLDVDSGHSTAHSPVSRSSSTLSSCCRLQFHDATHRALHKFIPRHRDELEVDIGDPLYVQKEDDDLWAEDPRIQQ
ncbi:MAPK8IP1 [Cordylochernes scorpioides]|uniref:MAPK8IP1 n=1 Tax=Cordylochernes scorpioides TaxID=51811 RepID=A0ABY6LS60_9ARAC|nr:MAPK8IP1 [Cordylochernes scorpioides]